MSKFKNIIKTIFSKQKVNLLDDRYTINITNNGFNLSDKNNIYLSVEWKNIIKIIAYKEDLFTTDLICLGLHLLNDKNTYKLHEEMKQFNLFQEALADNLTLTNPDWYYDVMQPPFKTNSTIIYQKY